MIKHIPKYYQEERKKTSKGTQEEHSYLSIFFKSKGETTFQMLEHLFLEFLLFLSGKKDINFINWHGAQATATAAAATTTVD